MRRAGLVIIAAALVGGALWYAVFGRSPEVGTAVVMRGDAAEIVYASGVVEPLSWARVAPLVRERIVSLCDCEGSRVAAGDELARLDDREPQAVLSELIARQAYTARELGRLRDLLARNVGTRQELERAESEEARLEALIAAQRVRLESYVLRAPRDGVVLRQDGEVGEIAEPGATLFRVGQLAPLIVLAEVNEEDVPKLAPGQRTLIKADAFPGRALEATVARITPMGDPAARTYRVRFGLPEDTPLMIGMSVEVNVVVRVSAGTLLIPASAVGADGSIFVLEEGIARRRVPVLGIRATERIEVLDGLAEGETVIAPPPEGLADGARVRVRAP